jgi:hypothetical protein
LELKYKSYERNKKTEKEKEKNPADRTEHLARRSRFLPLRIGAAAKGQRGPTAQSTWAAPRPNKAGPARAPPFPFYFFSFF